MKIFLILLQLIAVNAFGVESGESSSKVKNKAEKQSEIDERKTNDLKIDYDSKGYKEEEKFPQIDEKKPSSFEKQLSL